MMGRVPNISQGAIPAMPAIRTADEMADVAVVLLEETLVNLPIHAPIIRELLPSERKIKND